jgi:endonuclease YncB( thermonuclease family)
VIAAAAGGVFLGGSFERSAKQPDTSYSAGNPIVSEKPSNKSVLARKSYNAGTSHVQPSESQLDTRQLDGCSVVDGDTLNCGGERIRLLGIDAPELPGHCRRGRHCVDGNPFAASRALEQAMSQGGIKIVSAGSDSYGRTLANVYVGGRNVSCNLLANGLVSYVGKWDDGGLLAKDCPDLAH